MLKKGIKIIYLLLYFGFVISCSNEERVSDDIIINNDYNDYIKNYFNSYEKLFNNSHDILNERIKNRIYKSKYYRFSNWQLDSVFIFNMDSTRVYTTLNKSSGFKDSNSDGIIEQIGAKINGRWYLYDGAYRVVPREAYQDSVYAPLTFDELSYVSHKGAMAGLLRRNKAGKVEVNYDRLDKKFYAGDGDFYKCHFEKTCYDSVVLMYNRRMHEKKIDPKEIARIQQKMDASVRPLEPPKPYIRPTLWQEMWGLEADKPVVKIFESEAWKNRKKDWKEIKK